MASDNPRPTKAERRAAARAQAQALREEQERREKRAKITRRALLGTGVVAVAGIGTGVYFASRDSGAATSTGKVASAKADKSGVPSVVLSDGSWTYGKEMTPGSVNKGAKVLDVFFDYSCHFCAAFEVLHAPEITTLLKEGKITLVLHPCKILGQDWTDMVMNAEGLILDKAPDKALDFHNQIFALFAKIYQAQDASQITAENVAATAEAAGVPADVVKEIPNAISANTYGNWTELGTETFSKQGFQGTPTVQLAGKDVDLSKIQTASGLTDLLGA